MSTLKFIDKIKDNLTDRQLHINQKLQQVAEAAGYTVERDENTFLMTVSEQAGKVKRVRVITLPSGQSYIIKGAYHVSYEHTKGSDSLPEFIFVAISRACFYFMRDGVSAMPYHMTSATDDNSVRFSVRVPLPFNADKLDMPYLTEAFEQAIEEMNNASTQLMSILTPLLESD